jgi:hypothetical protein
MDELRAAQDAPDPIGCKCDEFPECTHALYFYMGVKHASRLNPAQPVPAEGAQAWLIERPGPEWATCWSGGFEWTKDSLKAIRFCRREDANQVAELFEFEDVRITEHTWE